MVYYQEHGGPNLFQFTYDARNTIRLRQTDLGSVNSPVWVKTNEF